MIFFINTEEDLLKEPNNKIFQAMKFKYPEVECAIEHFQGVSILIDSGAQINCISQDFLHTLLQNNITLEEIPVTNTFIKGATGIRSKKVKKQVYLPLIFTTQDKTVKLFSHFFVVEGLAIPILLGSNWLFSQNSIINLKDSNLSFDIDQSKNRITVNCRQNVSPDLYQNPPEFIFMCEKESDLNCHSYYQNSPVDEFDFNEQLADADELKIVDDDSYYLPKIEDFKEVVNSCNLLSEVEKQQLFDLLMEYKEIFSQKPGLLRNFEYKIKTKTS
jgi:hypothetical protein